MIVPAAVGSVASVAFDGLDSVTVKVSSGSSRVSCSVATVNVAIVSPGMKVSVSFAAVKSVPETAVSPVSADVAQFTVTVLPLAGDSVSVKVAGLPSVAAASATLTVGGSSSSVIVPVAVEAAASCAFDDGLDSVTVKVSLSSSVVSGVVDTMISAVVSLAVTVAVPVVVDPRSAATAVSPLSIDAVQFTVTSPVAAADSVTVKFTGLPSAASAFATLSVGSTSLSTIVTVASDGVPAVTPAGSVPKESATLSPASTSVSSVAASVKVCSVSVAPKVTFSGTPDQSGPVSPGGVAPPAPAAETGTVTSRPGAASSCTVTSTVPPSSTEYDSAPNDTAAERGVAVASFEGSLTLLDELYVRTWKVCNCPPTRPVTV